jgi:acyl-CoA reductase-like NAD-dependent aldehyde dehydrogenase
MAEIPQLNCPLTRLSLRHFLSANPPSKPQSPNPKPLATDVLNVNFKKVTLELGGKSPALVFENADISKTVEKYLDKPTISLVPMILRPSTLSPIADVSQPKRVLEAAQAATARIYREEIFGPVLVVARFDSEDEAGRMANDTNFELSACVYTSGLARALRVAGKIKAGSVAVNSSWLPDDAMPFGGLKESRSGRELRMQG